MAHDDNEPMTRGEWREWVGNHFHALELAVAMIKGTQKILVPLVIAVLIILCGLTIGIAVNICIN